MSARQDSRVARAPLVSVIIPAHNAQAFIDDAVESVLRQTYPNVETLVVDDASTDGTAARLAAYASQVRCLRNEHSTGSASVPRNVGLRHASGEYIAFVDADDVLDPGRIEREARFLSSHPGVELVFSDYRNFTAAGAAEHSHFQTCPGLRALLGDRSSLELASGEATALLVQENFGISGSFMIRRTILAVEPGFEPALRACEDFHFYYRVARRGRVALINEVGMMRRLHEANMTSDPVRMLSEGIRSRTLLRDGEDDSTIRALLDRYIASCHASLARHHADRGHYLQAIREDARALRRDLSGNRLWFFCRGVARTVVLAAGVHASADEG